MSDKQVEETKEVPGILLDSVLATYKSENSRLTEMLAMANGRIAHLQSELDKTRREFAQEVLKTHKAVQPRPPKAPKETQTPPATPSAGPTPVLPAPATKKPVAKKGRTKR